MARRAIQHHERVEDQEEVGPAPKSAAGTVPDFDRLIHERMRLGIVSGLAAADGPLSFSELKRLLDTTDGNVSVHARKLEDAGYIGCSKSFDGRTPRTEYVLTPAGRAAFEKYLKHMEALIHAMRTPKERGPEANEVKDARSRKDATL